jgi:hypothetical protein
MSSIRTKLLATAAGAVVLGGVALSAGPAFASGPASSTGTATVTVNQSISFAFTSSASFDLAPGVTQHGAIAFNVQTNDNHGYSLSLSGTDLTTGTLTIPAGDLTYTTMLAGSGVGTSNAVLSNSAAVVNSTAIAPGPAGDSYSQDWTANIPSNQAPGAYVGTLTYVATAN